MKIFTGTDHAGFELKEKLKQFLIERGYDVEDKGAFELNPDDDYPDFIKQVAIAVNQTPESLGIVLGGSGTGEQIAANKIDHIRAVEYYGGPLEIVRLAREHNDANILSLGARFVNFEEAQEAVVLFIETPFSEEERHIRRIDKLED